ncbi:hypothetical protein P12x_005129 [Tundrisphaera lichenicola]
MAGLILSGLLGPGCWSEDIVVIKGTAAKQKLKGREEAELKNRSKKRRRG